MNDFTNWQIVIRREDGRVSAVLIGVSGGPLGSSWFSISQNPPMHTENNSNPPQLTHLPELKEFLEPTASSINWIFHLTLTFAHEPKDEFAADKKLFLFLKEVAKAANRHPRELQYFTRIGRGDGGRLHCHVLLGDRHLNRIPKHALGQVGNSLQLAQFFKNKWTFGNAAAVPFQPIHLEYVTRASEGGFCDTSKALRQALRNIKSS